MSTNLSRSKLSLDALTKCILTKKVYEMLHTPYYALVFIIHIIKNDFW